jgi:hypothetical protein
VTDSYDDYDEPTEVGGTRINPESAVGHLLLIWAVDYIAHSPTKFTSDDKPSDVIVVDVVDLDVADENGYAGLLGRKSWWRQARLIGALREKVGTGRPMLAQMTLGIPTRGKPPYELVSMSGDPDSVARARAWRAGHPEFVPSQPRGVEVKSQPQVQEQVVADPRPQTRSTPPPPPPPAPPAGPPVNLEQQRARQQSSVLERLRDGLGAESIADDQIPF